MFAALSTTPAPGPSAAAADAADAEAAHIARLAAGERDRPLIALYAAYGRQLFALGLRLLDGDRSAAEELVQETFVQVWRSAGRYDRSRATPRTWIFMIARNTAIDMHRRASVRPRRPAAGDEEALARLAGSDEVDRLVVGLGVRDAMRTLAPPHREVLELGYDRQMTQSEIAAHLGIPLGTVKTRTYHALRELRVRLEQGGML